MNRDFSRKSKSRFFSVSVLSFLTAFSAMSFAGGDDSSRYSEKKWRGKHKDERVKRIRGITVTGVNSVKGRALFDWGEPFGTFNFPAIFAHNENGDTPFPVDEDTPDSAILATGVAPEYLFVRGETFDDVDPAKVNLPLRNVPINIDFDYLEKVPLPGLEEAQPLELSQAVPNNDITLGQWMEARSVIKIDCTGDKAKVKLGVRNLIPNRIYSVWATVNLPEEVSGTPGVYSSTLPIGGTPNIFITDENGDARYERDIKFCPYDIDPEKVDMPVHPVLNIELLYHADHEAYGAIPAPGIMLGLITFSHVVFPINVEMLDN